MKKAKIVLLTAVYLLIIGLIAAVISARSLGFNRVYFTSAYEKKFATPEAAFDGIWESQIAGDRKLYEAVLGRSFPEESWSPPAALTRPEIEWVDISKTHAYIKAAGWGGSFEKIGGRWVFQINEFGFYCRQFFRLFGFELARFE